MKYAALILLMVCSANSNAQPEVTSAERPDTTVIEVFGTDNDARFKPAAVQIQPGDVLRFEVREGLHTVTAYHPDNRRPLRIPDSAGSFDSGPLQSGDTWLLKIDEPGVYDYFCLPHERMGHAGRIISGPADRIPRYPSSGIPEAVLKEIELQTHNLLTKQDN